ncbi:alpha-taxilin [Chrysoperla carnea]|uniref:alpha-taxilin n=1 Tax=Chrysoperla carnea TaxID=189513 RepID=UPI001D06AF87|nr:alpha-taxilin [Chrysoperla carnea]XP_044740949.1 alpha-taxilin [Chrysoperla carnea]
MEGEENVESNTIESSESTTNKATSRTKRVIDDKNRKKDEKYIDNLIRHLKPEEKLPVLVNKCVELLMERRNLDQSLKTAEKNITVLHREYDQVVNEKHRQILINSRLENLCRELQKQNKSIKEETSQRMKDEEEKRKEVSNRFQATINEINSMMQQGNENNTKLRDDNIALNSKFQILCSHVEKREEQVEALIKQMDIERKLSEATIEQRNCEILANQETYKKEKEVLRNELEIQKLQCDEFRKASESLRQQIQMYRDQCEDFHSAVAKNNNMFETFQSEMDKMSVKLHQMAKENAMYQEKFKKSNLQLIDLCRENQQLKETQIQYDKQIQILKDLCRAMQTERLDLYQRIEKNKPSSEVIINNHSTIENLPPPIVPEPTDPLNEKNEETLQTPDALEQKEENLRQLKSSLNILRDELKCIQQKEDIDQQIQSLEIQEPAKTTETNQV